MTLVHKASASAPGHGVESLCISPLRQPPPARLSVHVQAASAEASFLRELHDVRLKAAKLNLTMRDVAAGCPDACAASGTGGYKAVAARVEGLVRRAAATHTQYERANKVRLAALWNPHLIKTQSFSPGREVLP